MAMRIASSVAAGLLLSACAAGGGINIVHTVIIDPGYSASDVTISGVPIPMRVVGAPRDGATEAETLAALTLPGRLGARPARAETPADFSAMRIVFAFAPLSVNRICTADAGSSGNIGGKAGQTEVSAALCRGDRQLSYAILRTAASGPRDPEFRPAARLLLGAIMPPYANQLTPRHPLGAQ
ncbi:MAG: hypothetical protein ACJAVR_002687 [Paracoccaceae bacterium]|jgi:hypothetical protein